jgi:hypothetical protein
MTDHALAAFNRGLQAAEAAQARFEEDYIGLPLAEPFARETPGLVVGVFPTAGRIPNGPNLVFPVRVVIRISLTEIEDRFDTPSGALQRPGSGVDGSLGDLNELARLSIPERQRLRSAYFEILADAAEMVAGRSRTTQALRSQVQGLFSDLSEQVLLPTYQVIAPAFMAWIGR